MDETAATPARPLRRHLHAPQPTGLPAVDPLGPSVRHRGEGNGVRMHAIYFALVSLVALLLAIGAIALTSSM
jgi:hypothetical protein